MNALDQSTEMLKTRTMREFKRAHVLQFATGELLDLDMNISAASDQELQTLMSAKCLEIGAGVLPSAPAEMWLRFAAIPAESKRHFAIGSLPGSKYRKIPAVVRIEV